MFKFDLSVNLEELCKYEGYRKTSGLIKAFMCGLPVVPIGFIVDNPLTPNEIANIQCEYGDILMCRGDLPQKMWTSLPRGRDVEAADINKFYYEILKINSGGVLLCFKHPSVYFTGRFIRRYDISAGINVLIEWFSRIVIEYVGQGFDVGDISRGSINSHTSINIPWEMNNYAPHKIFEQCKPVSISQSQYLEARYARIDILSRQMGYELNEIQKIPQSLREMDFDTFAVIYDKCIRRVINNVECFNTMIPLTLQINLYNKKPHVFEIWESDK